MIQTIDRAIAILFALRSAGSLTLTELGREIDLPVSTILGNVRQLHRGGLIDHDSQRGVYRLGVGLLSLSRGYLDNSELRLRSTRHLHELARTTGHPARVVVPFNEEYVVVQHEMKPDGNLHLHELGLAAPLESSAFGKLFLSYAAEGASAELPPPAPFEAERIRQTGTAEEQYEITTGEPAIASAISDSSGHVIAGIGLELPASHWPIPQSTVNTLRQAAQRISKELGAPVWPSVRTAPTASETNLEE